MKKVSIIIPVYNAVNTIERCVNSILDNHYPEVEIILIEDCSKDQSLSLCRQLEREHDNIICLHNKRNRGVSYTRNRGLEKATGEYTMFVDSDDWVENTYIEQLVNTIEDTSVLLAVCGYVNHDEVNNHATDILGWTDFEGVKKEKIQNVIKKLHDDCLLQQLWNKIFVTKLIREKEIRFDESISIGEDLRFIQSYIKKCNVQDICLLNKPLYHYMRDQEGSLMYRVGYESVEEPLKNMKSLYLIMGMTEEQADKMIEQDRDKQIELYAYLIMHNMGMKRSEKKRLIIALDKEKGMQLYKKNRNLWYKEKIALMWK